MAVLLEPGKCEGVEVGWQFSSFGPGHAGMTILGVWQFCSGCGCSVGVWQFCSGHGRSVGGIAAQ